MCFRVRTTAWADISARTSFTFRRCVIPLYHTTMHTILIQTYTTDAQPVGSYTSLLMPGLFLICIAFFWPLRRAYHLALPTAWVGGSTLASTHRSSRNPSCITRTGMPK